MGYYTYHSLSIYKENMKPLAFEDVEYIVLNNEDVLGYSGIGTDGSCEEESKWYEHDDDMIKLSKRYPELLFQLHGEGESNEDLWISYYKNGKSQHCPAIITFDEYDESKLE